MATYGPTTEDFATGAVGSAVGAGYGQVDGKTGTGTAVIDTQAFDGHRFVLVSATANQCILRFDFTDGALDTGWQKFAYQQVAGQLSGPATLLMFYAGNNATLAGSIRLNTNGSIDLRDSNSTTRWTSTDLPDGTYELAVKPTPGAWQVRIYANGTLIDQTPSPVATGFSVAQLDTLRFGLCTNVTGSIKLAWLRGDTTTEPVGFVGGNPQFAFTRQDVVVYDTRGSNGAVTVAQVANGSPTVTPVESPTGVFTFDRTGVVGDLVYDFTTTDLGVSTVTRETIAAGSIPKIMWFPNTALTAWV